MQRQDLKLAAYLDEISDDPEAGSKLLLGHKIPYVALRHVWSDNICKISNIGHKRLTGILKDNGISTILIASEIGRTHGLKASDTVFNDAMNICKYYGAQYLRVFITNTVAIDELHRMSAKCLDNNIKLLIEFSPDTPVCKPTDLALVLNEHIKLLYDPATVIMKQNIDVFTKYWTLLKGNVAAVDVRDFKIGRGYKPPGFGDTKIGATISDAIASNYKGWFIIEPSLGRRYGTSTTKAETFRNALDGLDNILNPIQGAMK